MLSELPRLGWIPKVNLRKLLENDVYGLDVVPVDQPTVLKLRSGTKDLE